MKDLEEAIYRRLLRLYPRDFRRELEEPVLELFGAKRRAVRERHRHTAQIRIWLYLLLDLTRSLPREHRDAWRATRARTQLPARSREPIGKGTRELRHALRRFARQPVFHHRSPGHTGPRRRPARRSSASSTACS